MISPIFKIEDYIKLLEGCKIEIPEKEPEIHEGDIDDEGPEL